MFTAALGRMEQVPFFKLNAADSGNAWQAALPTALAWLWQQLAPPDLRVLFPVRTTAAGTVTLPVIPVKPHHPGPCKAAARSGHAALPCGKPAPGRVWPTPGATTVKA